MQHHLHRFFPPLRRRPQVLRLLLWSHPRCRLQGGPPGGLVLCASRDGAPAGRHAGAPRRPGGSHALAPGRCHLHAQQLLLCLHLRVRGLGAATSVNATATTLAVAAPTAVAAAVAAANPASAADVAVWSADPHRLTPSMDYHCQALP